jgi:hypothetical protein
VKRSLSRDGKRQFADAPRENKRIFGDEPVEHGRPAADAARAPRKAPEVVTKRRRLTIPKT